METIWKQELGQSSHELRSSTLQALQGVGKIVDTHVSQALRTLGDGERQTAIDLFDHLVTPSGGKIAESVPDLAKRTGRREDQVSSVLDKLDHARIVRPVPAPPGQDPMRFRRYEIFHDVLAPTINRAIAAREDRRRARRLWRLSALAVGLLIVFVVLSGVFFYFWQNSVKERQIALSGQMAAVASTELTVDPDMSALLARQALTLYDTTQAEAALRAALPDIQETATFPNATPVFGAAFDPAHPNLVASPAKDGSTWIWNVKTGQRLGLRPRGGPDSLGAAYAVAFNPAGTQVAVGYGSGDVIVFSTSGAQLQDIYAKSVINYVQFVGNTGELAIATYQNAVLWRSGDGSQPKHVLYGGKAYTIAVDPHNDLEFAVATDSGTRIVNLNSDLAVVHPGGVSVPGPSRIGSSDAEFSSDGSKLASADNDGVVRIYDVSTVKQDVSTVKQDATLDAGHGTPWDVAFGAGKLIAVGYSSGETIVWDASTNTQLTQLIGDTGGIIQVQFSTNGQEVVTASEDGSIRIWRAWPRELKAAFPTSNSGSGMPNPVYAAEYSPDSSRILAVDSTGFAYVLTNSGTPVATINPPSPNGYVSTALYNQAGTQIVTADTDGTVDLWQASGSYQQINLPSPIQVTAPASYAAFSWDGKFLVVINGDGNAEVFNAQSGQLLHTLNSNSGFFLTVAVFSRDGRQILTGDGDGHVEVWNAATGREIRVLGTKGAGITDVQFDSTGKYFVTASDNGFVTTWSAGGQQLNSFRACPNPDTASLSPGGGDVVVACSGGSVTVFTAAGQQMTVMSDPGIANSAALSPDGKSIVTTFGIDKTGGVRVWSSELANPSRIVLQQLAKQRIIGSLSQAQINAALAGTGGWPVHSKQ